MCGICGLYDEHGASLATLKAMTEAIRHRGPDDDGFYVDGAIGLANRRLSIIDLDTGRQPISNEDGTIWIVFNGEIYNYPALREMLTSRGHSFSTRTDTEVIIHLYEEYGDQCVRDLQGMFTFALWDTRRGRLLLARDPLGQKQLYYTFDAGRLTFASEIKSLMAGNDYAPRMNLHAMHNLISLRCVPGQETLFEGIDKLPAGHYLTLENSSINLCRYHDWRYQPKWEGDEASLTERLHDLLLATVESHMLSDVPIGAFLSGGIDSSLIAAMMSTLSGRPINTFSIGVREDDFNELPYARQVAKRYHTQHHEEIVEADLVALLPQMMWHMEEPVDPFAFGVYAASRLASRHVKVVLGGDGGDEMYAGYDRYSGNQLVDVYCMLPAAVRKTIIEPIINRLPDKFGYNNRVQKLRWLVAMSKTSAARRYATSASFLRFGHVHKQSLYTADIWRALGADDPLQQLMRLYDASNAAEAVDKMLYTDVESRLSDHLLVVTDRMTMAHSIEGRSPYLDVALADFTARLPVHLKLKGRRLKNILRQISRRYLPQSLVERPKQGFSFPLAYWFKGSLRPTTERIFTESHLAADGYFRREAMLDLLNEHIAGKTDHNYRLWLLVNLELWYRLFIEGAAQDELHDLLARDSFRKTAMSAIAAL